MTRYDKTSDTRHTEWHTEWGVNNLTEIRKASDCPFCFTLFIRALYHSLSELYHSFLPPALSQSPFFGSNYRKHKEVRLNKELLCNIVQHCATCLRLIKSLKKKQKAQTTFITFTWCCWVCWVCWSVSAPCAPCLLPEECTQGLWKPHSRGRFSLPQGCRVDSANHDVVSLDLRHAAMQIPLILHCKLPHQDVVKVPFGLSFSFSQMFRLILPLYGP
jgi:hypothetical protein